MTIHHLSVARFRIDIVIDPSVTPFALPKGFLPFLVSDAEAAASEPLFTLHVTASSDPSAATRNLQPVATGFNDLGEARLFTDGDSYVVEILPVSGTEPRVMRIAPDFSSGEIAILPDDPYAAFTLDSMARIFFAQACVAQGAFLLHASCVVADGQATLFMGCSGTGKSTHARLWLSEFPGTRLINDDNPVVRVLPDGTVEAHGSPWSGKTLCYRRESAPVTGFVRLRQSPANHWETLAGVDAFIAILPGVSVITHSRRLYDRAISNVIAAVASATVGMLDCRPDAEAAHLCRSSLLNA